MARLECTVAHMGFPLATLNKRIKKTKTFEVKSQHLSRTTDEQLINIKNPTVKAEFEP
jgi:hypothetical protein